MTVMMKTCDAIISICNNGRHSVSFSENTPAELAQEIRKSVEKVIEDYIEKNGEIHIK